MVKAFVFIGCVLLASCAGLISAEEVTRSDPVRLQDDRNCFDLAILAGLPEETMVEGSSDPDDIIGHPLWILKIDVDQVLIGQVPSPDIETTVRKHTRLNPEIRYLLFIMRENPDGRYDLLDAETYIIQDSHGRFVMPLTSPPSEDWLYPYGAIPASYQKLLKPLEYDPTDAWWLTDAHDREIEELDPEWGTISGRTIIAKRGLYLDDWANAMREEGAVCDGA